MSRKLKRRQGFLLLELALVTLIGTVLVGGIWPVMVNGHQTDKVQRAWADVERISWSMRFFRYDTGNFPTSIQELQNEGYLAPLYPVFGEYGLMNSSDPEGIIVFCGSSGSDYNTLLYDQNGNPIQMLLTSSP